MFYLASSWEECSSELLSHLSAVIFHDCDGMLDENTLEGGKGLFGSQSVHGCVSAITLKTVAR